MRIQLNLRNARAKHNYSPKITISTTDRKLKIKCAPERQLALVIALKPQASQIDSFIEQLHLHFFTALLCSGIGAIFYQQRTAPVINCKNNQGEPENGLQIKHEKSQRTQQEPRLRVEKEGGLAQKCCTKNSKG